MAGFSERTLQVAVVVSFSVGFLAGWQANKMWKKHQQDKWSEIQKKLDSS
uniref:Mitoregulin n=1 Tax=Monopterus albus TaxID=43700 RepID=A0A3Q3JRM3_MONAL